MLADGPIVHRRLKRGEYLFRTGDAFHSLYLLNAGFAKTCHLSEDGRDQIAGFHIRGDTLGLDAVLTSRYACDAVALDVCDVVAIPYETLIRRGRDNPAILQELHRTFGAEIHNNRDQMLNMGTLPAEGRVAAFLLDMSHRFSERGFSDTELQLHMTRMEIGSLLGLKMETVSRAFSHFANLGLISVYMREVVLRDRDGLRDLVTHAGESPERAGTRAALPVRPPRTMRDRGSPQESPWFA